MTTIRLTTGQAIVRYLRAQLIEVDGRTLPMCAGVWAIFGHGNVAGLGQALAEDRDLPTYRAHNEQGMAHAAIAFAKTLGRRRFMACTTSVGPGATNMVTAAAVAHVNRLPVLFLPGDVFANRRPDPVLQQVEDFGCALTSANDCFRPVSRYFDRISRPEQLLAALPNALRVLTDPADCGPVTLALPQDVQAEAFDFPEGFFANRVHSIRRARPARAEFEALRRALGEARRPLVIAGGGVHYSGATTLLAEVTETLGLPVAETQAGKGALPWDHPRNVGALGVTGSSAANTLAAEADLILAVGTRLADFTTASRTLFASPSVQLFGINTQAFDAAKHGGQAVVGDAQEVLAELRQSAAANASWRAWTQRATELTRMWTEAVDTATAASSSPGLATDAQVLGLVNRVAAPGDLVLGAAGGLPGELHKLWRVREPGTYHLEYGYSCMGYEIAGGVGAKLARPDREIWVLLGDGSYLMMNSELATSRQLGLKLNVVLLDNRGFGCINRLQQGCGGERFNNLLGPKAAGDGGIDFVAHARALGAEAHIAANLGELEGLLTRARAAQHSTVTVIETDPEHSTKTGGAWWDVPVSEVSTREQVRAARRTYDNERRRQKGGRS